MQFSNIIQYLGEQIISNGGYIERLNPDFYAVVGAPNEDEGIHKVKELGTKNLLKYSDKPIELGDKITNINLTFEGWEQFESEKHGKIDSKLGFLAMEFGDQKLDKLINDFVKPSISRELGYELVDMRDVPRAGIIDNIMRAQIQDSEFVIVDLTHDNSGAYFEAGFAEGAKIPVIYICEETKINRDKTHFDTNHNTTVMWKTGNESDFCKNLIATIRRSLNLFQ